MKNLTSIEEGKTNAVISYLTIIGTVVAIILNHSKKNEFASFHIRQMIGLNILSFLNQWIIFQYFGYLAFYIIGGITLVLWFIGFMGVIKDEERKIPIFGDHFQEWFKTF